jgi:hypothetical protein
MKKPLLVISLLATTIVGGVFSTAAFARPSNSNTINHTNVNNSLDSNRPVNINRTSNGEVKNPGAVNTNVGNDSSITLTGSCSPSSINNNVNRQGTVGSSQSIVVEACNPAAGGAGAGGRRNR